ncbi:hypothetical protein BU25DRAFT_182887 [Macroventuria anomochaeta]|uniref:Uncharacterized protein n=1 Tax=Macroventuria anomochaeta TaxID=301207 RepID=A0ACB6RMB7_9PLEO|nr:uncharacterized protein BU25DRAFT_182887 [Macroventuria anomochaeta]KAF2623105.1 hypothetical protein BU25DRAFT_182887 [Macroventuria anomochaeta]
MKKVSTSAPIASISCLVSYFVMMVAEELREERECTRQSIQTNRTSNNGQSQVTCGGYRAISLDIVPESVDPCTLIFASLAPAASTTGRIFTCTHHDLPPCRSLFLMLHQPQLATSSATDCARHNHAQHTHGAQTTPRKPSTPVSLRSSCPQCHTSRPGVVHSAPLVRGFSPIFSAAPHTVAPIPSLVLQSAVWS